MIIYIHWILNRTLNRFFRRRKEKYKSDRSVEGDKDDSNRTTSEGNERLCDGNRTVRTEEARCYTIIFYITSSTKDRRHSYFRWYHLKNDLYYVYLQPRSMTFTRTNYSEGSVIGLYSHMTLNTSKETSEKNYGRHMTSWSGHRFSVSFF